MTHQWVHFIAIGGTGMGALASLLQKMGYMVTGSDGPLYPPMSDYLLTDCQLPIQQNYSLENLKGSTWGFSKEHPDIVIVGNAISRGHVESDYVEGLWQQKKLQRFSFAEALSHFSIQDKTSFVVCGTHGKSSNTTLLAWALEVLGHNPSFFVGAITNNFASGIRHTDSEYYVIEGDEYDTAYWDKESKFLHYKPSWVYCTGIEFDHADIFTDLEQIEDAFIKLSTLTKNGWVMVDGESVPQGQSISLDRVACSVEAKGLPLVRYGFNKDSKYCLVNQSAAPLPWDEEEIGTQLTLKIGIEQEHWIVSSPLVGQHNALNVVGVCALLYENNLINSVVELQAILTSYKGLKRRQEEIFKDDELVVIDDFAHHPTAIEETIRGIKHKFPKRQLAAFFEPRSATSARNVLFDKFSQCFQEADAVFLLEPSKKNIPEDEKLNVKLLVKEIKNASPECRVFLSSDASELARDFSNWSAEKKATTALVMSNGSFDGIHKKIVTAHIDRGTVGQAMVEYLLLVAMLVSLLIAVFVPQFENVVDKIENQLSSELITVLSQSNRGIPIQWFAGPGLPDIETTDIGPPGDTDAGSADANSASAADLDSSDVTDETGENGGDGSGGSDGKGKKGKGGTGTGAGATLASNGPGDSVGGGGAGDGGGAGGIGKNKKKKNKKGSSGGGGASSSTALAQGGGGQGSSSARKKAAEAAKDDPVSVKNPEEEEDDGAITERGKQLKASLNERKRKSGGDCNDISLFELLKILAMIAVGLLVVGMLLNSFKSGDPSDD